MYRVRFHLQSGRNYMKWQIRHGKKVMYVDPSTDKLEMMGCKLVNKLSKAKKVHKEGVKDVAGWVECESVVINNDIPTNDLERLFYNPIRDPQWRRARQRRPLRHHPGRLRSLEADRAESAGCR